jgi:NodT family efflux transporter outer membrane factor (OMF) lipoprotein
MAAVVALLGACGLPSEPGAEMTLPGAFSGDGVEAVPDRWWRAFDDAKLDALERRALTQNFTLESAWQRLRQAEAVARREGSNLLPDLDAFAEGRASRGNGGTEELGFGLSAAYEVDLWGRIRSRVEAGQFRARAGLADYRAAALTLSAEVARTWYARVESWEQRDLIKRQIDTNEKILRQLEVRLGEGRGRSVDLLRQRQLVRATREQLAAAEADIGVLGNRLAVLQGRAADGAIGATERTLPELPPPPQTGLPVDLVQRRPDVLRAFHRLRAADAELAAAVSDRYPRLNLGTSLSASDGDVSELFDNWIASVAGDLVAPVFDAGERAAEVRRARARRAELLADYSGAVLVAIREVEDSLVRERKQRERITELKGQLELAGRSYRRLLNEYLNGASDFIDVLTSLTEEQQLQRDLLTARRNLIEFRIGLYRALAGGFRTSREF